MPTESEKLVLKASHGDAEAIRELLERHLPTIRAVVHRRMSQILRAKEESVDIVQSVCRQVLENQHLYEHRGEKEFSSWLLQTIERKVIDHYRHLVRDKRDVDREQRLPSASEGAELPTSHAGPSTLAGMREEDERIQEAFGQLEPLQRDALRLHHFEGLPFSAIAERLGITLRQARWSVYRAKYHLTRILGRSDAPQS